MYLTYDVIPLGIHVRYVKRTVIKLQMNKNRFFKHIFRQRHFYCYKTNNIKS